VILRILTWNIHAGIGADGHYDLERILAVLRRQDCDIVALQEIEGRGHAGAPFRMLREALGGSAAEAATILGADGHYGHMVISRWPLARVAQADISVPHRERRCAISADVQIEGHRLHLIACHLGLRTWERAQQAARLTAMVRLAQGPLVMLGDFNEWQPRGPVTRALAAALPGRTRLRSFPARRPLLALDRVYCRPAAMLGRSWTDPSASEASDHLPLMAELFVPTL